MPRVRAIRRGALPLAAVVALMVSAGPVWALGSFDPPGTQPAGIDFAGDGLGSGVIYHVDNYSGDVYSITTAGVATLLFNIATATGQPYTYWHGNGLCFVPSGGMRTGTFYITRADRGAPPYEDYVRSFTEDGTFLHEYDVSSIVDRPYGITFDGTYFWLSSDNGFVKCDSNFNMMESFSSPWGAGNGALDFDPATGYIYNASLYWDYITVMDRTCQAVYWWYLDAHYRVGITVGPSAARPVIERALWIVDSTAVVIQEIEDVYYTPVSDQTWSTIKSMFR